MDKTAHLCSLARHWSAGLALCLTGAVSTCAAGSITIFGRGTPRLYLDVAEAEVLKLKLTPALQDLRACFQHMTGQALPCREEPLRFDPAQTEPLRFECTVAQLADGSASSSDNVVVALVLSPNTHFDGDDFAAPGAKAAWECTWHRARQQLEFSLRVANAPYYGPGYGPFVFARQIVNLPAVAAGVPVLRLALEMRHQADGADLRGSYALAGGPWVSTEWFDPSRAGTDTTAPGASDKNGPQAWSADWPTTWAGRTAFYITAYGPKGRNASTRLRDVLVSRAGTPVFDGTFAGPTPDAFEHWVLTPAHGSARRTGNDVLLTPEAGTWSSVGLRATRRVDLASPAGLPLRLELATAPSREAESVPPTAPSYEIVVSRDAIVLRAPTPLGLQNAVYALLDRWGCRWVLPGKLGEVIPKQDTLTLPLGTIHSPARYDPAVEGRGGGGDLGDYYVRNQAGWDVWLSGQHYWGYALPPEKHFAEHPEWYALIGGTRQATQLCTSNPEVVARVTEVAKAFLRNVPAAASFPLDPNDNIDFCQCERCLAQDPPGTGEDGNPLMSDRVLRFANAVAEGIRAEFPNRLVAFYAYWTHTEPPVSARPAPNVAVIITRSNYCLLHLQPTRRCPSSLAFHDLIRRWHTLTPNLYTYEYDPISWTGFLPCPTYLDRSADALVLLRAGIRGGVTDRGPGQEMAASTYINSYFERRFKANPSLNPEAELRDMCRGFFGPVGKPMQRYYRELARVTEYDHPGRNTVNVGLYRYDEMFSPKLVAAARAHLDKALAGSAGQSPYAERVRFVDLSQRYLEAYLDGVGNGRKGDYAGSVAAFDRADARIAEMGAVKAIDAADARGRLKTARLKTLAQYFPDRLGMIRRWQILGPFDNSRRDADMRRESYEPLGAVGSPVTLANGRPAAWWEYHSPEGLVNLEAASASKAVPWKLSWVFAGLRLRSPQAAQVQLRMDSFFPFRVYLNGREVLHRPGLDSDCPDKRLCVVDLPAGDSAVVLKLSQTTLASDSFPWGLYFRLTDSEANPIPSHWSDDGVLVLETDKLPPVLAVFPTEWLFRTDPEGRGSGERWFAVDAGEQGWVRIPVAKNWEQTSVGPYDGDGWYRVRFRVPAEVQGKRLALTFDGVDEEAWVYVDGVAVGERSVASTGRPVGEIWEEPFTVALPDLAPDREHLLAVRVHDSKYAGGIYRPVRLRLAP